MVARVPGFIAKKWRNFAFIRNKLFLFADESMILSLDVRISLQIRRWVLSPPWPCPERAPSR